MNCSTKSDCEESSLHAAVSNPALDLEIPQASKDSSSHMLPFVLYRSVYDAILRLCDSAPMRFRAMRFRASAISR